MSVEASWDAEYSSGRYLGEPPVGFVRDVIDASPRGARTLYVGCGNGRNFVPLLEAGLDVVGLDISRAAIDALKARVPDAQLVHGDLRAAQGEFDAVVGIQVFQHGTRAEAHAHIAAAQQRVRPGGLFCIRVNAVGTDVWPEHDVVEDDEGLTVRYRAGAKAGLDVHFFAEQELERLFADWEPLLPLRLDVTPRTAPAPGQWSQWEAIWRQLSPDAA
ncbi:MAG TPA: class I SAM-dependent methyltransferase [Gaiellaceae bacterium]|nr:class I SAM-dependent methyltransferase [Gaiellaceae bacterium]